LTALLAVAALPLQTQAEDAPPGAAPGLTISANVGLFSQYIFRGVSYSRERPAIQGGIDLVHPSGFYAGAWSTSLSGVAISNASSEIDFYGGYATAIGPLSLDAGLLYFHFPGGKYNLSGERYETLEAYAGATWSALNVKYSHAVSDFFGVNSASVSQDLGLSPAGRSRGSGYLEANLNLDIGGGYQLGLHAGRQSVRHYGQLSYTDYRIGVTKDLAQGVSAGLAYTDTNAKPALYTDIHGLDTSRGKWLVWLKKTL
jgi:uncharacterized protein (TIGR02001 family)